VAGQQLGPKTGLRHPDFCCVLGTTLSLYYSRGALIVVVGTLGTVFSLWKCSRFIS
jgi:hypothetical protein